MSASTPTALMASLAELRQEALLGDAAADFANELAEFPAYVVGLADEDPLAGQRFADDFEPVVSGELFAWDQPAAGFEAEAA